MFEAFFETMRRHKVPVTLTEWVAFQKALQRGLAGESMAEFYFLARAVLVKSETWFDHYDRAFLEYFAGVECAPQLADELLAWLKDPRNQLPISPEALEKMMRFENFEDLLREFRARLEQQKERHDGGNKWIGTGGTSAFGHSGRNDAGIRVGGPGGGRSAVQIAMQRHFKNYRKDLVLDTRQIRAALKDLRILAREGAPDELDLDGTVKKTCDNGGDIDLDWRPARRNNVRVLLLMDVGGSMTPHTRLVSRLFSAAHASSHFKDFRYFYFHNCVYDTVFEDIERRQKKPTAEILRTYGPEYKLICVGDACMAGYELTAIGGAIDYWERNASPGIEWLRRLTHHYHHHMWLNPDPKRYWDHYTVRAIGSLFPMYELTLDGLESGIERLKVRH